MIAGRPISSSASSASISAVLDVALLALGLAAGPVRLRSACERLRFSSSAASFCALIARDLGGRACRGPACFSVGGVGERRARRLEPDLRHRLAEQLAVLGLVDRLGGGADHLDAELLEHAHAAQRQRAVERGLPAHGRQQRVGPLLLDDLGDDLRRDRLDIGGVGQIRIGHDRRRIGIDQDDPVALVLQRLAGLGAGIVELAGLADDDRAGADDQDRLICRFVSASARPSRRLQA